MNKILIIQEYIRNWIYRKINSLPPFLLIHLIGFTVLIWDLIYPVKLAHPVAHNSKSRIKCIWEIEISIIYKMSKTPSSMMKTEILYGL